MKSSFAEYYKLSDAELTALLAECMFVVDANVLLN